MKFLATSLFALTLPTLAAAQITVASCEGKTLKVEQSDMTIPEAMVLFDHIGQPSEDGQSIMRFESAKRNMQYWRWTSVSIDELKGHCQTQYYLARKPKDGTYLFTNEAATFEGCPEGVAVPAGMSGTRDLSWPRFFTPHPFFEGAALKFDFERLDYEHWLATAKPVAGVPGEVDIVYDIKVVSPSQVDITGKVNVKIDGGAIKADCTGTVEMIAKLQ